LSDEDALRFRGRGYIQITGRANYDRIGKIIGVDLVNNPDFALQPDVAYKIYVFSLVDGYLTGKKISDFINETETDYVNARRVINGGLMNAPLIADTATRIERILKASLSNPAANGPS
jgi:putative chitinase